MESSISDEIALAISDTKYLSTRSPETSSSESVILAQIYSYKFSHFEVTLPSWAANGILLLFLVLTAPSAVICMLMHSSLHAKIYS